MFISIIIYFVGKTILPTRIVSWLCILVSFPFIAIGFLTYNGMKAEEFLVVLIKYFFLVPRKKLLFKPYNFYEELTKGVNINNEIIRKNKKR